MKGIFLLLGSNMGTRSQNLQKAIELINAAEINIVDYSSIYETEPWGEVDQDWFLNMVIRIDTILKPEELLESVQSIENQLGRKRSKKWGSRIIDIDILYYDNVQIESKELTIPHPGIAMRRFTIVPLSEMIPNEQHPILKMNQKELCEVCPDDLECRKVGLKLTI